MTLPPLFPVEEVTRTSFLRGDQPRIRRLSEPGLMFDQSRSDRTTAVYPAVEHIVSSTLGGANTAPQVWSVTVTPVTTRYGSAAADQIGPSTITGEADGGTLEDMVDILVAAASASATLATQADVTAWKRFRSIVVLSKDGTTPEKLVATSRVTGQTFTLAITPGAAGTATAPAIDQDADRAGVTVGTYVTKTGTDAQGRDLVRPPEAGDVSADLMGPVLLDQGTEEVDTGYGKRVYRTGTNMPVSLYGHPQAFGATAVARSGLVYVRLTLSGDLENGFVTDAAGAADGATANLWTMTPVVVDSIVYELQVVFGTSVVTLSYTSGVGATDLLINDAMRAQLALHNVAGGLLEGITGSGTTTFIMTGPATGESFTAANINVGDMGPVETTAGVQTHVLAPNGETFIIATTKLGSAPVAIPHP